MARYQIAISLNYYWESESTNDAAILQESVAYLPTLLEADFWAAARGYNVERITGGRRPPPLLNPPPPPPPPPGETEQPDPIAAAASWFILC